jgi:hypothetical protein
MMMDSFESTRGGAFSMWSTAIIVFGVLIRVMPRQDHCAMRLRDNSSLVSFALCYDELVRPVRQAVACGDELEWRNS